MSTETTEATRVDLLTGIERQVARLDEYRNVLTPDEACQLLDAIDGGMARLRLAKETLETFLIGWLPDNGGELRIGDVRYYVGPKKKTKCRSVPATIAALMDATGGDYDAFCDTLSSNAIKYGAARKVLGDKYPEHFEEIVEQDLEKDAPKKVLNKVDERFIK